MVNTPSGKIFAIGDIHGCYGHLETLMTLLPINRKDDLLLFIGDYIDRGPDSRKVVDDVIALQKEFSYCVCLIGNHEQLFLDYLEGREEETFLYNGGAETLISYGFGGRKNVTVADLPPGHEVFYRNLKHFYETDDYIFVHAGLRPGVTLDKQQSYDLIWIRFDFIRSSYNFGKKVIFGHTPLSRTEPFYGTGKVGIDTGAVYGGRLTCLELPAMRIYQVSGSA